MAPSPLNKGILCFSSPPSSLKTSSRPSNKTTSCKSLPNSALPRASNSTTTKRTGTSDDRPFPTLKIKASYCSSAARFVSFFHKFSMLFTSAIKPHPSDIFQLDQLRRTGDFLMMVTCDTFSTMSIKIYFLMSDATQRMATAPTMAVPN